MGSFSGLGIGLIFVFGFILFWLVAELYYLLCWKKRAANNGNREIEEFSLFCWKRPNSFNSSNSSIELTNSVRNQQEQQQDLELGSNKDFGSLSSPTVEKPTSLDSYTNHGFNPLFESFTDAEINILRSSSPPKFKFLKDAEAKFINRLLMEEAGIRLNNGGSVQDFVIKIHGIQESQLLQLH